MDAAIVTYARKTRRGAVRKEVAEKYVRDDVGCGLLRGAPVDAAFIASTAEAARRAGEPCGWVVPDTNVVLHQMDVLEHGGVDATLLDRLIICQTVAEEVKHNDRQLFRRLCAPRRLFLEKKNKGPSYHGARRKTSTPAVTSARERTKRARSTAARPPQYSRGGSGEPGPGAAERRGGTPFP